MSSPLPHGLQKPHARSPITYSKVLLAEGMTAFQFLKALVRHLRLLDEIEIRNFGGVNDFSSYLKVFVATSGFDKVTSVGIVRDAEENANYAFSSICNSLRTARLNVPNAPLVTTAANPKISVFILPDCMESGSLETLCMTALSDDASLPCISQYFEC